DSGPVPPPGTLFFVVGPAVVLLAVVVAGLPVVARIPAAVPLLGLAAVAIVVPTLMATGPGLAAGAAVAGAGSRPGGRGFDGPGPPGSRPGARLAEVGGVGRACLHACRRGLGADAATVD